jgi:hypothetical protein
MEPIVKRFLLESGVDIYLSTRVEEIEKEENQLKAVIGKRGQRKTRFEGDVFIDATGTAGPTTNCNKYGNRCAMCILRCPTFGGRVSLTAKAGIQEMVGQKGKHVGAMSGACKLFKDSLSQNIINVLEEEGVAVIPVPRLGPSELNNHDKACQQYALPEFYDNLILLDTGHAKLMVSFYPLDALRKIQGFENARYEDPYAGGRGNSVRYVGMSPRDDALKVTGVENLFCGGEKAGLLVGHTEAIVTGTLAGYNAVRHVNKEKTLILPTTLAVGDAINYVRTQMETSEGLSYKYTFSGSVYFNRMKQKGLYTTDIGEIKKRIERAGMTGIFSK